MPRILRKQDKVDAYNFPYTLNPYTGCPFGCHYCYSKSHWWRNVAFSKYDIDIANKSTTVWRDGKFREKDLRHDLETIKISGDWIREIQIGNNFEPYPPVEPKNKLTRRVLELFLDYPDWIVHLETKSPVILNELDIIKQIPNFQVEITITTLRYDDIFEPHTPTTQDRLDLIKELADNNIFVRVMIMPVLGRYTDINAIIHKAFEYGARDFKIKDLNYFTEEQLDNMVK